jgi:hypothetical protein
MHAFTRTLAVLLIASILSSCASFAQPKREPLPPRIDCRDRAASDDVRPAPQSTDWRVWAKAWIQAVGVVTQERELRTATADCYDRHREAGDIR